MITGSYQDIVKRSGEFQVNSYTSSRQENSSVTMLQDGGFVVTWQSRYQDGSEWGIYAQRYDSSGEKAGDEFLVNTYTDSWQLEPSITALADGGFVITWQSWMPDGSRYDIYAQRYDSSGTAVGAEFLVNSNVTLDQKNPAITALTDGGFVISWEGQGNIYGQRYDDSGAAVGAEFLINTHEPGGQWNSSITALTDGGFVVTWQSNGQDDSWGIYGQRYNSSGTAVGDEFRANTYTTASQQNPSVAALNDGGFVVVWQSSGQDGSSWGIYAQRYNSSGAAVGAEFQVNSHTLGLQADPSVAATADGGFTVTWVSYGQTYSYSIYAQRYNSGGEKIGDEFLVNSHMGSQKYPAIAPLADGGFVITWEDFGQDGSGWGIYGQRYSHIEPTLEGTEADNILSGTPGADIIFGFAGNDTISGLADDDLLLGDDGADLLDGGAGSDVLLGGSGSDILAGGAGSDVMTGGSDADIFTFSAALAEDNIDTIMDFTPGEDKIELDRAIFTKLAGMENFVAASFVAGTYGSPRGGGDYILYNTSTGALSYDADGSGSGAAVQFATLDNKAALSAEDFILTGDIQQDEALDPRNGEFRVNSYTSNHQRAPVVTELSDGGFLVVWSSARQGYEWATYGQRYNSNGLRAGDEFQVNNDYLWNSRWTPWRADAVTLADGSLVITWQQGGQSVKDIYGQRYTSSGARIGDEFRVTSDEQRYNRGFSMAALNSGGFIITWTSYRGDGSSELRDVFAQRYNSSGEKVGDEFRVNTYTSGNQGYPSVTELTGGGFVVSWASHGGPEGVTGTYAQRYTDSGNKVGGEFLVGAGYSQDNTSIAGLADGGFIVSWTYSRDVYAQRYTSSGDKDGDAFQVNSYASSNFNKSSAVTALAGGGFIITWHSEEQDGSGYGIYAQRYTGDGVKAGDEFLVNSYTDNHQMYASVAALADGGFVISWQSNGQDGSHYGVYAKHYNADGTLFVPIEATLEGTSGDDILTGTPLQDIISGLAGDDTITGLADDDLLLGDQGADHLDGSAGADTLTGGIGNDTFIFTAALDTGVDIITDFLPAADSLALDRAVFTSLAAMEAFDPAFFVANDTGVAMDGDDYLVYNTMTGALYYDADGNGEGAAVQFAQLENQAAITGEDIVLIGEIIEEPQEIIGTDGDDLLIGTADIDTIRGLAGNDTLNGLASADSLFGGEGDDLYLVDDNTDILIENAGEGNDSVESEVDYILGANLENLILTGTAANGLGNELSNMLVGNEQNNTLNGFAGDDTIDGGIGADIMIGGDGDDLYIVDNAADIVEESIMIEETAEGNDTVQSSVNYILGYDIENLILTGEAIEGSGNYLDNTITGNDKDNIINGDAGVDTMAGGLGNDLYLVDSDADLVVEDVAAGDDTVESSAEGYALGVNIENLILAEGAVVGIGNELDNTIIGNEEDNTINGGIGADTLIGGLGDDLYIVDNAADLVEENADEGSDTVQANIDYTLGANLENLILAEGAVNGTGNELDNSIEGNDMANAIDGGIGADTITGGAGADIVIFNNAVTSGINTIMDFAPAEDKIQLERSIFTSLASMESLAPASFTANAEGAAMDEDDYLIYNTSTGALYYDADGNGEGAAVQFAQLDNKAALTAADFILVGEIDDGGGDDDAIIGTDGDDILHGTNEADLIDGLAGNDSLFGRDGDDTLIGGDGDDMLRGYGGADLIDGDAGNDLAYGGDGDDTVNGGAGNDSLYGGNGADLLAGGDGDDFIFGGEGRDSLDGGDGNDGLYGGTGNDVINGGVGTDMVQGGHGNDSLTGGADNDSLYGGSGSDNLGGGSGMDFLNGGDGADFLSGGADNDTVMGGMDNDIIHGNEGDDLLLGQQGDDNLHGDDGNDLLIGGAGDDTLIGDSGMDTLFGKEGNDLFVLDGDSGDIDSIIDFASGDDHLQLSGEIFAGFAEGELGEELFAANVTGSAMDADDRILYNTNTGALFYDADGNGEGAAVQLAILTNKEDIQSTDILVA